MLTPEEVRTLTTLESMQKWRSKIMEITSCKGESRDSSKAWNRACALGWVRHFAFTLESRASTLMNELKPSTTRPERTGAELVPGVRLEDLQ